MDILITNMRGSRQLLNGKGQSCAPAGVGSNFFQTRPSAVFTCAFIHFAVWLIATGFFLLKSVDASIANSPAYA